MTDFITKAVVVAVLIGLMYYVTSPYQNCMRDVVVENYTDKGNAYCTRFTPW